MNFGRPTVVAPGIYQLGAIGARVTVVVDSDEALLVDTGAPGSFGLIASGLKALGLSVGQLRYIVLTHYHPDHSGSLARLSQESGAKTAAHQEDEPFITGAEPPPNPFRNRLMAGVTQPFMPLLYDHPPHLDVALADGDEIPLGTRSTISVIHTPGHTAGSISLYLRPQKILLVGDALQYRFHRLSPPARGVTQDYQAAQESMRKLLAYDFKTLCFGHFPPLRHDAWGTLDRLVHKVSHKSAQGRVKSGGAA
ncbi:MAG: MBL fold metallo-hydrolase [Chloroflexi bacterium]|nr:MBL fold metallo-hydrolase [Chloroflexota bacterium]